ncbi:glutamine-hydrolyzing carbamoyl-phosphate synthase small subunit [Buchnera aphidicola (Neophyllaphis podocarpi)]|uniref:glutamine-hydrolyzing carbamoyl-phosphate synthase small subunit n=1 Tax=Buchnera aphidicola TaxID=9 RepID=UPI0031B7EBF3
MSTSAVLVLEDGTLFYGKSVGIEGWTVGEVVFNTSMTGYQEIITDPSYSHQIITLTYPHIGNVGTNEEDVESNKIYTRGLIIRNMSNIASNYRSTQNLKDYLIANKIIAISDIDTRKLTRLLRDKGTKNGCIIAGNKPETILAYEKAKNFKGIKGKDLVKEVTTNKIYQWNKNIELNKKENFKVIVCDYGIKKNILKILEKKGCNLIITPAKTSAEKIINLIPDGIFLSNGPGDPKPCTYIINTIKKLLEYEIPIFGICLGHQLLALASGAKTKKMKFGHHGGNHPVIDVKNNKVIITSQNHSFTVEDVNIPKNIEITHKSLFDGSIQGIHRKDKPAFGFQGHPEASPGPNDAIFLFDYFIKLMKNYKTKNINKKLKFEK